MKKGIGFYVMIFLVTALFITVGYLTMASSEPGKIPATLFAEIGYGTVILFAMALWPDKEQEPKAELRPASKIYELNEIIRHKEDENQKLYMRIYGFERVLKDRDNEISRLKNPPPPAKFKVGERAGNFVINHIGEDNAYSCIDANGIYHGCFRESDIEAMMKLNPENR